MKAENNLIISYEKVEIAVLIVLEDHGRRGHVTSLLTL